MRGHGRTIGRAFAVACAAIAICGLSGCSLLTPSRADVVPDATLTKLTSPSIATQGVLTVALNASDAPQAMTDDAGKVTGYTADVARALGHELGLKVTFVTDSAPKDAGASGGPDIYLGATSADATDAVAVSGSFLEDAPALFAKQSSGTAAATGSALSVDTFANAAIAVQTGSSTADVLSKCGINATQKPYANVNECFKALESGEVAYVACDATSGSYLARAYPGVAFVGTFDAATSYGVAIRSTNTALTKAVTDALNKLSSDGSLEAIHAAWYGSLPASLSDQMITGITTTAEREKAAAEQKAQQEAEQKQAEEAAQDSSSGDTASGSSSGDASGSSAA